MQNGCPNNKIILGIPTHGRTWTMDDDSGITGVPPLSAAAAGESGPYTQEVGLLSYPEICSKIATPTEIQAGYVGKLRKINDPTKRYGKFKWFLRKCLYVVISSTILSFNFIDSSLYYPF